MTPAFDTSKDQPVRLTVLGNETAARMAEQQLLAEGIPSYSRSLQGGPGLWGSAFNLPHALYVRPADAMRAREVLTLLPLEVLEREGVPAPPRRRWRWWLVVLGLLIAALLIITASPLAARLYG
ncbi:MAG: hypothetical protein EXR54_06645 [Dehalococcoidia bacterium]|nr:hypothetical protein [Dehalococcoidia bacterium]MSQ17231.1 hypothetical protein [Dehalococcoidia bacterium]